MFRVDSRKSSFRSAIEVLTLIFHVAVRKVRSSHGNAVIGLLMNVFQLLLMVIMFFVMMDLMGGRRIPIRGDFMLYTMSGIFMFMTHVKAIGAVSSAEGPTSSMMLHAPMNPIVSICAAALSALYTQVFAAAVVLYLYHVFWTPIVIEQPIETVGIFLMSWASGVGIGMIIKSAMPWNPEVFGMVSQVYQRANMIASGKMFIANALPMWMLTMFDWNPLFHLIDQGRGFIFANYFPRNSNLEYPIYVTLACIVIGLMGEFYTRRHISVSWNAKR